ncbi:Kelch domain-containing protein 10 [Thelohanellus kitauei]|uniref:Kelch domain-containing protein 10 n=1 Tax=Thelohanellus kitauei TaxID=669202 RepID=A0A0C2NFL8_THEKT|nr:Kelch domain-containing protein 10 [Thelohanellus kitauei]
MRIYDFSTNTWTSRITNAKNQHYPDDRIFEAFAFSENLGFMSGGMEPYINTYYSDIWMIDLLTLEWFKLQYSLTRGVFYHRISIVDDCYLYSFGGYSDDGSIDTLESFMVQPPKLYRLCRESIIQSPNLSNNAKSLPVSIMDELKFNDNISSLSGLK